MVTQVRAGAILRRGADKLTAGELKWLMDNEGEVERVIKDIDERRAVYQQAEQAASARVKAAEKAEAKVLADAAAVGEDRADLDKETAAAGAKHQLEMDALRRRTKEVFDRESAAAAHTTVLDGREQDIKDQGIAQENELRGRLEAVEEQEAAAEERDQALQEQAAELGGRLRKLVTAESLVKSAVATLR